VITTHVSTFSVLGIALLLGAACNGGADVTVRHQGDKYVLMHNGEPYRINGAGIDSADLESFAAHGGTSFRTWRTDNGQQVLDEAQRLGLTVVMCIEIARERHGFDYDDHDAVAAQLKFARDEVLKYKDHPALLVWMIGNEPNLHYRNPKVFDAVNEISEMIHDVDGKHPTTASLAGFNAELIAVIDERAPDLDFISIQLYGEIVNLPQRFADIGFKRPYMITEWGTIGHWEVGKTTWGAPIEQHSSEKADTYLAAYEAAIRSDPSLILGSYVFLWGQKQERTPTWYGMFLADGAETEAIDVMHYLWNGEWPKNRSPRIEAFTLDGRTAHENVTLEVGEQYRAAISAIDPDGDDLAYRWEVMRESEATQSGGDPEEVPEILPGLVDDSSGHEVAVTAPAESGAYRLFVYVYDGQGHAGHANIPFYVN